MGWDFCVWAYLNQTTSISLKLKHVLHLVTSQLMFVEHRLCIKRDMALGPMKNMESINYAPIPKGRIVNLADGETST